MKKKFLAVDLHGKRIGRIQQNRDGLVAFSFDSTYLHEEHPPVLSQSLIDDSGNPIGQPRGYPGKLPPFFENLLPEGPLRTYLAQAGKVAEDDSLGLLRVLGRDLPGAVRVRAASTDGGPQVSISAEAAPDTPQGGWRFSLSGVQFKLSVLLKDGDKFAVPARNAGGDWIMKFPSIEFPQLPENEFALMSLAERAGLSIPERRLVPLADIEGISVGLKGNGGNAFVVRRFDRAAGGQRVHMEDFAQVFGLFPDQKYKRHSYAGIAALLRTKVGVQAAMDFTRQAAFSALTGNGDMHLKNVSLLYVDPRAPSLSPAYDLVSTVPYFPDDKLALGFGRSKLLNGISDRQAQQYAQAAGLDAQAVAALLRDTSERTMEAWKDLPERSLLPRELDAEISRQIEKAGQRTVQQNPSPTLKSCAASSICVDPSPN